MKYRDTVGYKGPKLPDERTRDGCSVWATCRTCPLPECRYQMERGAGVEHISRIHAFLLGWHLPDVAREHGMITPSQDPKSTRARERARKRALKNRGWIRPRNPFNLSRAALEDVGSRVGIGIRTVYRLIHQHPDEIVAGIERRTNHHGSEHHDRQPCHVSDPIPFAAIR